MILEAGRLWRTVRHLKPVQFYRRLCFQLHRPNPNFLEAPGLRAKQGIWQATAERAASLVGPTHFRFLNAEAGLIKIGWDNGEEPVLWRYNQHYFDDLNAKDARHRAEWHKALLADWIKENPPFVGTGWAPYPTSLRIVNWIKWAIAGSSLGDAAHQSLAVQVRWLTGRMEYHLLGNHLFANAKALVFAGLFFEGEEARTWLDRGVTILKQEIPEQILADGGQFELSPMYHALAVEDMLDLVNIARTYGRNDLATNWSAPIPSMLHWLKAMSHPDDAISFFNDSAIGIAPPNQELWEYAQRLGFTTTYDLPALLHLENSGYLRMTSGAFALLADLARVGPDYLPGHAHADTLSFELSYAGQRVFVNSGTSEYGIGPERLRQRGTAAHNTVTVDGQNSSEVWSGFRVGRRARPLAVSVGQHDGENFYAQATHDGYRYLKSKPLVSRRFELSPSRLFIIDELSSNANAEARFHLHPTALLKLLNPNEAVLELPDGATLRVTSEGSGIHVEDSTWHPEFGLSIPNLCLVLPLAAGRAKLSIESI